MNFCSNCGNQCETGVKFCNKCGAPLKNAGSSSAKSNPKSKLPIIIACVAVAVVLAAGGAFFFLFNSNGDEYIQVVQQNDFEEEEQEEENDDEPFPTIRIAEGGEAISAVVLFQRYADAVFTIYDSWDGINYLEAVPAS